MLARLTLLVLLFFHIIDCRTDVKLVIDYTTDSSKNQTVFYYKGYENGFLKFNSNSTTNLTALSNWASIYPQTYYFDKCEDGIVFSDPCSVKICGAM